MFLEPRNTVRPFVGAGGAFLFRNTDIDRGGSYSEFLFGIGPMGGAHIFLSEDFSLDLSALFEFQVGTGTYTNDNVDRTADIIGWSMTIFAELSGWI